MGRLTPVFASARFLPIALAACSQFATSSSCGGETELGDKRFTLPDGFSIERVAGPPLVDRPICADFDEQGRLYVADSSGSNAPVEQQLAERPHRILRLEDTDGDGVFDARTVFADRMMFPEGTLWHDGSLYVSAPPSIWKLTDTDGDGVADKREEWFQAGTLTGCANDLHGPYLGPDGYIYWCKGAFAQQSYKRPHEAPFVTQAAHIFRCRPDAPRDPQTGSVLTSAIEPVMTGGMDNPVEVIFTPGGERIFTTTFLVHPGGGNRDGLIHAIYGGVYGKDHARAIAGHPRTGDLMPVLHHLGAAAPCGLARYESRAFGSDFRDNLFACSFNMRKVTRHVLRRHGATYLSTPSTSKDHTTAAVDESEFDFLKSDNADFHPTDVLEDADGSLLVIDTGGWYKLCCPTSQLAKPDVLGAIYRIRRDDAPAVDDPRGANVPFDELPPQELVKLIDDPRPAVRKRAIHELSGKAAQTSLPWVVASESKMTPLAQRNAVWALCRIDSSAARSATREALADPHESVRQAAAHAVSVWRDGAAVGELIDMLPRESLHNRRVAAEALGRLGDASAVPHLLAAAADYHDRTLEHSLVFALIEIADVPATRRGLAADAPHTRAAALIAIDQMPGGDLQADEVIGYLPTFAGDKDQPHLSLQRTAAWIVDHHPEWAPHLVEYFNAQLDHFATVGVEADQAQKLRQRISRFAADSAVDKLLRQRLEDSAVSSSVKSFILRAAAGSSAKRLNNKWIHVLGGLLRDSASSADTEMADDVIGLIRAKVVRVDAGDDLFETLMQMVESTALSDQLRLQALAALPSNDLAVDQSLLSFLLESIHREQPSPNRTAATSVLQNARLDAMQLAELANAIGTASPLDLPELLATFKKTTNVTVGNQLVASLAESPLRSALRVDTLKPQLAHFPTDVQQKCDRLYELITDDNADQLARLEQLLQTLPTGDVRRGQQVFRDPKSACATCHAIGYLGGEIGPDLTRIGRIRNRRDLLESIVFPSASLVRSYESVTVITSDGLTNSGMVQLETDREIVLVTGPDKQVRIDRQDVEKIVPSTISIMPAGLDKQISPQQLSDLLAFLESAR